MGYIVINKISKISRPVNILLRIVFKIVTSLVKNCSPGSLTISIKKYFNKIIKIAT